MERETALVNPRYISEKLWSTLPPPAHFIQNRFHLFFRYPIMFQKYLTKKPVPSPHDVILYLFRERLLDLFKSYILSRYGNAPETMGSLAGG